MNTKIVSSVKLSNSEINARLEEIKAEIKKAKKKTGSEDILRTRRRLGRYELVMMYIVRGLYDAAMNEVGFLRANYSEEHDTRRYRLLHKLCSDLHRQHSNRYCETVSLLEVAEVGEAMRAHPDLISWLVKMDAHLTLNKFKMARTKLNVPHKDLDSRTAALLSRIIDEKELAWLETQAEKVLKSVVEAIEFDISLDGIRNRVELIEEKFPMIRQTTFFKTQIQSYLSDPLGPKFRRVEMLIQLGEIEDAYALLTQNYIVEVAGLRDDDRTMALIERINTLRNERRSGRC